MIKKESFFVVHGWMRNAGLSGNELLVYAIIYGFSQSEKGFYNGSLKYLSEFTGASKNTVISCLKKLQEKGLISKKETHIDGVKFCLYYAIVPGAKIEPGVQKLHRGGAKIEPGWCKNCDTPGAKIAPNNIYNNIADNIVDIDSTPSPTLDAKKTYLKKIYDAWSSHRLPLSNASRGNFAMFETIELRPVLSQVLAMAGQVDDVLQAIDNAAKVRDLIDAGGSWYSSPDTFRQFVCKIDRYLPGVFDIAQFMKKQVAGAQYVDDKIEF